MSPKKDVIDWKDDLLTGIELAIMLILGFMFFNFLSANPDVKALLFPEELGMFMLSFGVFVGGFLFVKWVNREKV